MSKKIHRRNKKSDQVKNDFYKKKIKKNFINKFNTIEEGLNIKKKEGLGEAVIFFKMFFTIQQTQI